LLDGRKAFALENRMLSLAQLEPPPSLNGSGVFLTTIAAMDLLDRCGQVPDDFLLKHAAEISSGAPMLSKEGVRQISVFRTLNRSVIWVITKRGCIDRTTLLLPWEFSVAFENPLPPLVELQSRVFA
jgi:hypothetical protein